MSDRKPDPQASVLYLRHVLMLAMKEGWINRNSVSGVKFFPEVNRTRFLNDEELDRLQNVMSPEDWKLVAFAIETGLRQGEQFPLRWDQVDLENGMLTIPMPKGGKTRHVPLSDGAKPLLRSLESFLTSAYVFPGIRGKESHPLDARALRYAHLAPAHLKDGVNRGSLFPSGINSDHGTVTKTVTKGVRQRKKRLNPLILWCARQELNL